MYVQKLGGSPVDIGLVRSAASVAGLFLYPIGGYLADKAGRVRLVSIVTIVYAFSFIPFAYAPNWQTLAIANFSQSLVLFYAPILTVLQADSMPVGMRSQGFAISLSIPGALGAVSPFIGGYLVDAMGILPAMHLIYVVSFGAGLFVAILRWFALRETLDVTKAEKIDYRNIPQVLKDSYRSFFETLRWLPEQIRILAIMQVVQSFFIGIAASYWVVYATAIIGISATTWGLAYAIQGGGNMVSAIPAGRLMDKFGRRKFLIPFASLVPLFPLLFLFIKNFVGLSLLVVIMAAGNSFLLPGFQSLLADYTPRERRGRVISVVGGGSFFIDITGGMYGGGMLLFVPSAIAQTLGGVLYEMNPIMPFLVMSAGMVIVALYAFPKVKEPVKMEI